MKTKIIILLFTTFCSLAHAEEKKTNPRDLFTIDENGKVETKDKKAERTFSIPPIKTGFIFNVKDPSFTPAISVEAFEFDIAEEYFAFDIGGAENTFFVSLGWELVPLLRIGPSVWYGYNIKEKSSGFGVGFTFLKF